MTWPKIIQQRARNKVGDHEQPSLVTIWSASAVPVCGDTISGPGRPRACFGKNNVAFGLRVPLSYGCGLVAHVAGLGGRG
jgi:hypothetical protein